MAEVAGRLMTGQAVAEQDWISVGDLARLRGVSHQAISKRARNLAKAGQLPTRRIGKNKLIHVPTFDQLAAATLHPAQGIRNFKHGEPEIFEETPTLAEGVGKLAGSYTSAVEREKNAKAELAEMQLAERRGDLVPASEIEAAAIEAGTKIRQAVEAMRAKAGQLYAAGKGGEEALAIELNLMVSATSGAIAEAMTALAKVAEQNGAANG
jgi:hypothetical protein